MEIQLAPEAIDQTNAPTLIQADDIDTTFRSTSIDLVSASLGSTILAFSDEWFAAASNLLNPLAPIRQPGKFTFTGAWYDGWETRRHNANYDWVVVRLGVASGRVRGVEIDTAHFNGNHAPEVSVEGVFLPSADDDAALRNSLIDPAYLDWQPILPRVACGPNTRQAWLLPSSSPTQYTHVRLRMYPDGGIARFRLYGSVVPVLPLAADVEIDMAAAVNGGLATSCSDQHFGTKDNLLLPGRGKDMGDGWETKRTRGEHVDWTIVRLGVPGSIKRVVVDTAHYRGNFPQAVEVYAAEEEQGSQGGPPEHDSSRWVRVVAPQRTMADKEHEYTRDNGALLADVEGRTFAYAKLVIIPDGGVKRFRVFGCRAPAVEQKAEVVVTDK